MISCNARRVFGTLLQAASSLEAAAPSKPPTPARPRARTWLLAALALAVVVLFLVTGMEVGANRILPGPLPRQRDAITIALTMLRHGTTGYAGLFEIGEALDQNGMSFDESICRRRELFEDVPLLNEALRTAAYLEAREPDHLCFMDGHEKGLCLYCLLCFALFGIRIQSFFYGFAFVLAVSVLGFMGQFRRRPAAMIAMLALCLSMVVSVQAIQVLEPDVNAIHSSRYLPLLSVIPVLHLLLAALYREPLRLWSVGLAAVQVCIIDLALFSRSSGFWLIIAFAVVLGGRWLLGWAKRLIGSSPREVPRTSWWPAGCLAVGLALLWAHTTYGLHPHYYGEEGKTTRTSWHHFLIAAHYNPHRSHRFGIPAEFPYYGDVVAYHLFEEELQRRGETLESYLHPDESTWALRATDRRHDYCWNKYDLVVRDVFLRLAREHPLYVLSSVLRYEPLAAAEQLFAYASPATAEHEQIGPPGSRQFFSRTLLFDWRMLLPLLAGTLLALRELVQVRLQPLALVLATVCLMSLVPALASGVMTLCLVEPAFVLVAALYFVAACLLARALAVLPHLYRKIGAAAATLRRQGLSPARPVAGCSALLNPDV